MFTSLPCPWWFFPRLTLVLPASWRDAGPRMGRTPVSRHRSRHITVSHWFPRCGGFNLVYVRSRGRAPSLPPLQGWISHRCTCMCPPVFPLAILFPHFVLSYLRQTLFPSWRRQLVLRAIGLVLWCNGPAGPCGAISASHAGQLGLDKSEPSYGQLYSRQ